MTQVGASGEFSFRVREKAIWKFQAEKFDILIVGGGITGAATARDAASRGLKVALVEMADFAWGTSSRSSKLIHGGLRYLENFEFKLIFEALAERALLLKTAPHLVRPLSFYLPIFKGDPHGKNTMGLGLWLYDLLALFRAPGRHRRLTKQDLLHDIPFLREEDLQGGFQYFDASMWDDGLAIETLRSAHQLGAQVANYVQATGPIWEDDRVVGFHVKDVSGLGSPQEIALRASQVIVCAGPWTDIVGKSMDIEWKNWLRPSKGIHLVFSAKKIPMPGALVMTNPEDHRISFVIPRKDYGPGVVIVGTTDGPTDSNPSIMEISRDDVNYLMALLKRTFPILKLTHDDILSAYVGVRPLMGTHSHTGSEGQRRTSLQKVSREHHIAEGPGGTIMVAGGKYTTHRRMAEEIVDESLSLWNKKALTGRVEPVPDYLGKSMTKQPVNLRATAQAILKTTREAEQRGIEVDESLIHRFGEDALELWELDSTNPSSSSKDPEGFPMLAAQLRYEIRKGMVLRLEDFYLRRSPLFLCRRDGGWPWAEGLAKVWAEELGLTSKDAQAEIGRLEAEIKNRQAWRESL